MNDSTRQNQTPRKPGSRKEKGREESKTKLKPASGAFRFTEAKGKTVDFVEFYSDYGFHIVEIGFDDRTAMHFTIEPAFHIEPGYSSWKTGNERVLRRWAPIHCS